MRFLGLSRETVSHASSGIFLPEKIAIWMVLSFCAPPNGAQIGQLDKDCNSAVETIQTCFCMAQRFILPLKTLVKRKKTAKVQNCNQRSPVRYIDMTYRLSIYRHF